MYFPSWWDAGVTTTVLITAAFLIMAITYWIAVTVDNKEGNPPDKVKMLLDPHFKI